MVPLGRRPRPFFDRQATHPTCRMRPVGLHRGPPDSKHVAMAGKIGLVVPVQNLHFKRSREGYADCRQCVAPDEQPGVAAGLHVPPLELEDEVFVLPRGSHHAGGLSGRDDQGIAHGERLGRDVDGHPARQILTVKERSEVVVGLSRLDPGGYEHRERAGRDETLSFHRGWPIQSTTDQT